MFGQPLTHFNLVGKKHISDSQHSGNMFIVFVAMKKKRKEKKNARTIKTNEYFSVEADQEHKM